MRLTALPERGCAALPEGNSWNIEDALMQLADTALKKFPESDFAIDFGRLTAD
jgi:hypothetical protein